MGKPSMIIAHCPTGLRVGAEPQHAIGSSDPVSLALSLRVPRRDPSGGPPMPRASVKLLSSARPVTHANSAHIVAFFFLLAPLPSSSLLTPARHPT
uniref:Uncharacterized protein n=1 Tax=Arundo donax TaxID=35708 RepID=A0A0A9H836_ARUDO